ncbi:MAG TPA: LacI family DNA-binding transcriptional regulator [Bacteroidota bacterium]|nr:LacI family DNA-binding transcriptional regulator [Bacteroidota bacterium]
MARTKQLSTTFARQATMKDVARKANVAVITVSRALNNKPDINPATRSRILKIARDLNYTADSLARGLVTRKSHTIAVIIPDNVDSFYATVVQGIGDQCREHGYGIFLWNTNDSAEKELEHLRQAREKRTDGILIYPVQKDLRYLDELQRSPVPFVFLNRHSDDPSHDYVMSDNAHGAYLAVHHLLQRGHKNITYVCAKPDASSGKERIAGSRKAIAEAGLAPDSLQVLPCEESIDSSYTLVRKLLAGPKRPSALFMWDDRLAVSAIKAIREAGLRIPQDVAVVGYDDIEISAYLYPALTTVRQSTYEIGARAASNLLDKIGSPSASPPKKITLKPELVVRETS